jgi:RNA-directed DNA polymerase
MNRSLAQRTQRKVQVLQLKLHNAAKEKPHRTFGILYDKICMWEILWISWIRVQKNKGAPGVDGRTIEAIKADGELKFLREIQEELVQKKYKPQPIRRVFIKKTNGKLRPLGIPVVKDRVIQGAVKLVLEPIFEANFLPESYGFRPKRSCQDAMVSIRKWVTYGYTQVIDADISSYFDSIDHSLLINLVQRRVRDKWILRLIRGWLRCRVFEQDREFLSDKGTPQGGVISPLLANIYLHPLDKFWASKFDPWKTKLVRYCDDFVVLIRDHSTSKYMHELKSILGKLRLELSAEKTRIVKAEDGFQFLGFQLVRKRSKKNSQKQFCYCFPSNKAMTRIRQKVRSTFGREYRRPVEENIKYLNPILRGWANYYSWANSGDHFHKIERYVIQSFYRWNRRKRQGMRGRFKRLSSNELYRKGLYRMHGTIKHVY